MTQFEIKNIQKSIDSLIIIQKQFIDDFRSRLTELFIEVRNDIVMSMRNTPRKSGGLSRAGRVAGNRNVIHNPSAEGNPPAPDTSTLIGQIDVDVDKTTIQVGVRTQKKIPYGAYLEDIENTLGKRRRPFLKPQFDLLQPKIQETFAALLGNWGFK